MPSTNVFPVSSTSSTAALTGSELLEQFRPEMSALPLSAVLKPRVDAATAASVAMGSMRSIELHRAALVARFGERATVALDRIVPTAQALIAAEAAAHAVAPPDLEAQATDLRTQRDRLLVAATTIVDRGIVSKRTLKNLNGGTSYQALIVDTTALVQWFRIHASEIASISKVSAEELDRAERSALAFATQVADRTFGEEMGSPFEDRARIFTLFFRNYELVARMLGYVRWREGDADQIAQTIYQRKRVRRDDGDAVQTGTPVSNTPVAPGMPGGNPFQS